MTVNGVLFQGIKLTERTVDTECTIGQLMLFKTWWQRNAEVILISTLIKNDPESTIKVYLERTFFRNEFESSPESLSYCKKGGKKKRKKHS